MLFSASKVVLCVSRDHASDVYVHAIQRAFAGGTETVGDYLAAGPDTGVGVKVFDAVPPLDSLDMLDSSLHTLVVVLADHALTQDGGYQAWLDVCALEAARSNGRHEVITLDFSAADGDALRQGRPSLAAILPRLLDDLGETAIRPAYAALLILSLALARLRQGIPNQKDKKARFFISHAKRDALPLAAGLRALLDDLPWLDRFYDAEDIKKGDPFAQILEHGVESSMLIVLRTDIFDERPWCRQEVKWAEERGRPMVVVEARTQLTHSPSILSLSGTPWIRVPDGNTVRVLYVALREWLTCCLAERVIEELSCGGFLVGNDTVFIPRAPTLASLVHGCNELAGRKNVQNPLIVHPEPALDDDLRTAAVALMHWRFPNGNIQTVPAYLATLPNV